MNITSGIPVELRDVEGVSEEALRRYGESVVAEFNIKVQRVLAAARNESIANPPPEPIRDRPHLLLGCDAWLVTSQESQRFNSAILIDPSGHMSIAMTRCT